MVGGSPISVDLQILRRLEQCQLRDKRWWWDGPGGLRGKVSFKSLETQTVRGVVLMITMHNTSK